MNILPKKRWHVRTKDNIARVRKDEAEAKEIERIRLEKLEYAESEARINFLRKKSGISAVTKDQDANDAVTSTLQIDKHVDLFADYQSHIKTTNKELEKEKKEEQEKYEKQIGYLTYLGQDTNEALKLRSWYEVAPKRAEVGDRGIVENDLKNKYANDPLTLINNLLPPEKIVTSSATHPKNPTLPVLKSYTLNHPKEVPTHKLKKSKKEKKHKRDKHKRKKDKKEKKLKEIKKFMVVQPKKEILDKLRKERLKREASERARQDEFLAPTKVAQENKVTTNSVPTPRIVQKYNSQFNPELAKQNMI